MSNGDLNRETKIELFASPEAQKTYDTRDEARITEAVRNSVLASANREYLKVKVKVKRSSYGAPRSLIAYMLRKETYTADVVRIDVDDNYDVLRIEEDYSESEDDDIPDRGEMQQWAALDFVAGTPVPEIASARKAVENLHQLAVKTGLRSQMLIGSDANVANYRQLLASGISAFVNVGHGKPDLIVLDDGTLSANWFSRLAANALTPCVVYFNSCQVHNAPLEPSILGAGARTFLGGNINLLIGASEEVCKCFWHNSINVGVHMEGSLRECEQKNYPEKNAHGISGDTGVFMPVQPWLSILLNRSGAVA